MSKTDLAPRRTQMADIARMAGVSSSTVSRALSGSALIPEATRERIIELARSLNYQVNVGAANLRKRSVQTVGVVLLADSMQAISDPFILSLFGSVADALDEQGYSVLLTRLNDERKSQMQTLVSSGQVAGLVVIGQLTWHQHLNKLFHDGLRFAVWGAALPDAAYPVVGGDNEQGGYLAASHLLSRGCRRIAFLGDIEHPEAGQRYAGYLRAHREAGVEPDVRLRQGVLFNEPMLLKVVQAWLSQGLSFDAVFATSDVAAIAVISALNARGIDVPRDVKVVGYDDIEMAGHVFPSLTSIRQPTLLAGQALVNLLHESQAGLPTRSVILPTELQVRDSTR
ncbi:LacI family DNA-binding transcriptional regulator [Limnohabitans sp. DCL3]|uniref:LacI family DNA-binding transcriptional regulator n=1 Tax=Limnohabitans sp. DCL3 TaxID=3374103 RepID=UPI003A8A4A35